MGKIENVLRSTMYHTCINPDMDKDGTPTNRCGGCWQCVYDQIIECEGGRLATAIEAFFLECVGEPKQHSSLRTTATDAFYVRGYNDRGAEIRARLTSQEEGNND